MRTLRSTLALALAGVMAAAPLLAQQVIDQNQPVNNPGGFNNLGSGWTGQSFVQSGANISGVGVFLGSIYQTSVSGPVTLNVYDRVPNGSNSPALLQSTTQTVALGPMGGDWFDFLFAPVAITPGSSLFFALSGPLSIAYLQPHAAFVSGGSAYAPGQAYSVVSTNPTAAYIADAGYDLTFRTYTTLAQPVTAPEPASLTLLATGLIGVVGAARRRRGA